MSVKSIFRYEHNGETGLDVEAFLAAGDGDVDAEGVHVERVGQKRADGIDNKADPVAAAQC